MTSKPEIAVIGLKGLPAFGGAAAVGESIVDELKHSFDFTVFSVASHTIQKSGDYNGFKQIVFKNFGKGGINTLLYYLQSLFYCLFIKKFDLIHLHHSESGFITPFLRLRYKVIVTFHLTFEEDDMKFAHWQNNFFRWSEKKNINFANLIVSVSDPDRSYVYKKYGKQILYIPNGISIIETQKDSTAHKYIMYAAGRIYQKKGLHFLLEALKKINYKGKLKIAGDLDQVSAYRKQITELSKDLDIEFLGMIKEKNKLMEHVANAQLFIFPSTYEAMSMMLLEAGSQKTPLIASDIPSNKAVFNNDEVLFFSNSDSNDLAEKIQFALNNSDIMQQKTEKAFQRLLLKHSWKNIAAEYQLLYNQLLNT